jgi:hypothetical protein
MQYAKLGMEPKPPRPSSAASFEQTLRLCACCSNYSETNPVSTTSVLNTACQCRLARNDCIPQSGLISSVASQTRDKHRNRTQCFRIQALVSRMIPSHSTGCCQSCTASSSIFFRLAVPSHFELQPNFVRHVRTTPSSDPNFYVSTPASCAETIICRMPSLRHVMRRIH